MNGYNTNEEIKRLNPEGDLRSKAQRVIHGLHGKRSPKNPIVLIAEKIGEGIKQVVEEVSSLIPGDSSQQEVKMSALEQFRQLQAARKAAAEKKAEEAKEALIHEQVQGLRGSTVSVDETGRLAGKVLPQAVRNKLRVAQGSGASRKSVSPPKPAAKVSLSEANERRAKAVRNYLKSGPKSRKRSVNLQSNETEETPGSEENVGNNQKGMASQNKPANAVAAGNAAASAAAAAGASPAVVNATANAVTNAVANAPPGQEAPAAAAAAEQAVVAAGGNVQQAAAASGAASENAGGNANAEAEAARLEAEAESQEAARAAAGAAAASGAPPAAVEAAAAAAESGAPPAAVEAAVVNAGGSPAAASNAAAASGNANAGAANRLAALSGVLPPVAAPGAGVAANAPAILNAASAAAAPALLNVPGLATSPLPMPGGVPCPPVGLAPGTYAATVQRTMTGETAVTFKSTGPLGKGFAWSMPGFGLRSGKGKTVEQQVKEEPKAWNWKGINFGKYLSGLRGFAIDLTPLLMALQAVGSVAGGAVVASVGAPMYGSYLIGQGFVLLGLAMAGAFQALGGFDFKKLYPGITLANVFGLGTDPRMKKLAKAISEYQTLNKQGIQQVVNAAKQARTSRFSNNAAVQNRVEAEIKTVKRLLAGKQGDIKMAAKGLAKEIADDLFDKLSKEQQDAVDTQLAPLQPVSALPNVGGRNLTVNRQQSAAINEIKDDFTELNVLVEKMYLAAAALGNVPEAQYPMAKAEAIRTAYAQFLKDVQVLDELQQLAQGSNAKASVNKMFNKTQKYRSNVASYGRAAQQGLSGFGSRIGSMFTRKVNASKPNSSGYVPGVIGSNRYTNANRAAQQVALAPAAQKKGFFGRLGNSLKSVFSRKPSAAVQKLTATPANRQNNGAFNQVNPMRNAFTSPQAAAAGQRLQVQPRPGAIQPAPRGFFGRVRNTLGVPRGLTLRKGKEGNYSGFGRNVPETANAGESENPFGLSQGEGNAYEALNRAQGVGAGARRKRNSRKTQKRKAGRR
jgi:hypothetical protein